MAKATQAAVNYRRGFGREQCGKCTMYRKADGQYGACTAVTGNITAYGVCNVFAGLINPFGSLQHHERVARVHSQLQGLLNR